MADAPVTHIAGLDVTLEGRYMRQRCAWCDAILVDYDLAMVAVLLPEDGSEPQGPGSWPAGRLVRVEGSIAWALDEGEKLPDDACSWATLVKPEDFNG